MTRHDKNEVFSFLSRFLYRHRKQTRLCRVEHSQHIHTHTHKGGDEEEEKNLAKILKYFTHLVDHISHHFHYVACAASEGCARAARDRHTSA